MAYLKITPGVSALSDTGRVFAVDPHRVSDELRTTVLSRDDHTCRYCGFKSQKYQEPNFIGTAVGPEKKSWGAEHYATACIFCYQCFHVERIERMQSGAVIWLPEIGQATLHHICRALYVARVSQGAIADAAREAMEALLARKAEAKNRLGTDSPRILATVLQDFLEGPEYMARAAKLKGFRILPLDRRVIKEGDLEFNQFPQVLAYWRAKDGPFGERPPRTWPKLFYEVQEKLKTPSADVPSQEETPAA